MKIKGRCLNIVFNREETEIELSPRELLEQITHKEIGELLDMINLPETCNKPIGTITKEFEGLDLGLLIKKANYLMTTDAEGWAIGNYIKKILKPETCACEFTAPKLVTSYTGAKYLKCQECWKPLPKKSEIEQIGKVDTKDWKSAVMQLANKLNEVIARQ